jgi:ligand-binding sensor domain-containing protein
VYSHQLKLHTILIVSILLLFIRTGIAFGQHPTLKHYTVDDGLPSNQIYAIHQDYKGYIWLATNNGVSRFDGKKFKNFSASDGLPDNDIVDLREDISGRVWLSCYSGAPCYILGNKVHNASNNLFLKKLSPNGYVNFFTVGKKLNIIYEGGTSIEVNAKGEIKLIPFHSISLGLSKNILSIKKDGKNSSSRLNLYNEEYEPVDSVEIKNGATYLGTWGEQKCAVFFNDSSCLRYSIENGVLHTLDHIKLSFLPSFLYEFNGQIWSVNENSGIVPLNQKFERDFSRPILFPNKLVHRFLVDREGNYWGCSLGNGLFMIPQKELLVYDQSDGLYQNTVLQLSSFKNELFLGFNNSKIQRIYENKIDNYPIKIPQSIQGGITSLSADSNYIVGGTHKEVIIINKHNRQVQTLPIGSVKSLFFGKNEALFIGTHANCYLIQIPKKHIDTIGCGRAMAICQRKNEDVLIGNFKGLLKCRRSIKGKWIIDSIKFTGLDNSKLNVTHIVEVGNYTIIGTSQNGIFITKDKDFELVDLGEGIKKINCTSLFTDAQQNVWASSFLGIHKITIGKDIHHYKVTNYRKKNGLPFEDINSLQVINGTIYAACSNGLMQIPIVKNKIHANIPHIYINDFLVNDSSFFEDNEQTFYQLPANTSNLTFYFSGIDFKSIGNIQFRYRIKELNEKWQFTSEGSVRYESLPSGQYTFEVDAINSEGVISKNPDKIFFTIANYWWQSWLFRLLLTLIGIIVIAVIIRRILNAQHLKQIKETSLKKRMAEIELKAIKAQINPHFIFNTLNSIQYFIGNNQTNEAELYLSKLGSLLRNTLHFSSKTVVKLKDEIHFLDNYLQLEKLRFDEYFSYQIDAKIDDKTLEYIEIPPMVLQPHIENSLKHSFQGRQKQKKEIIIRFEILENQLICTIKDNGIGRKASMEKKKHIQQPHSSKGIELSKSKLEMYAYTTGQNVMTEIVDLYNNATPIGTSITIIINVNKNDYYNIDR